jgi:hypothetical protein
MMTGRICRSTASLAVLLNVPLLDIDISINGSVLPDDVVVFFEKLI